MAKSMDPSADIYVAMLRGSRESSDVPRRSALLTAVDGNGVRLLAVFSTPELLEECISRNDRDDAMSHMSTMETRGFLGAGEGMRSGRYEVVPMKAIAAAITAHMAEIPQLILDPGSEGERRITIVDSLQ